MTSHLNINRSLNYYNAVTANTVTAKKASKIQKYCKERQLANLQLTVKALQEAFTFCFQQHLYSRKIKFHTLHDDLANGINSKCNTEAPSLNTNIKIDLAKELNKTRFYIEENELITFVNNKLEKQKKVISINFNRIFDNFTKFEILPNVRDKSSAQFTEKYKTLNEWEKSPIFTNIASMIIAETDKNHIWRTRWSIWIKPKQEMKLTPLQYLGICLATITFLPGLILLALWIYNNKNRETAKSLEKPTFLSTNPYKPICS